MELIYKASVSSIEEFEDSISVAIMISDPLVNKEKDCPLFYEQIDVSNRIEKLKQTSISGSSLSVKVKRGFANRE